MLIQDNQLSVYAQKQSNIKQLEQSAGKVNPDSESGKQSPDFKSRFEEKAASLSISENMGTQIFEIRRAAGSLKSESSSTQIADTALNQVQGLLHRTNALTVQALNRANTSWDQQIIEKRIKNLKDEIERISRIEDPAKGEEIVQTAEAEILNQPAEAVTAQANQDTERVLGLLL